MCIYVQKFFSDSARKIMWISVGNYDNYDAKWPLPTRYSQKNIYSINIDIFISKNCQWTAKEKYILDNSKGV